MIVVESVVGVGPPAGSDDGAAGGLDVDVATFWPLRHDVDKTATETRGATSAKVSDLRPRRS